MQKRTGQLLIAIQVNLNNMYLANIFETLNNLNLNCRSAIIISLLFIAAEMSLKLH